MWHSKRRRKLPSRRYRWEDVVQPLERRLLLSTGTVLASVYDDANGDGTRDGGEGGLSGVTLYVDVVGTGAYTSNDPSAQTAGSGSVTITGVPAGTYTVREVVPNGFTQTQPVEGGGQSVTVTAGGTMATPAAFGVEPDGSIGGAVYLDANGNGSEEPGETAPTTAVTVELRGEAGAGPVAATTTTRADGTFAFADVTPGTYAVLVVVPADYTVTQPAVGNAVVSVAPAGAVTGVTFGYAPLTPTPTSTATTGAITGTAYVDANGDGTDDAPRAGAVIYLDTNGSGVLDAGEPTATAGAQGTFTFADVTPGTYVVRQTVPLGDAPTQPGSGLYSVTVTAGGTATVAGFGVEPLPASGLTAVLAKQPPAAVVAG
jgi:serine-aspartate repeat-containing protein C/D/E